MESSSFCSGGDCPLRHKCARALYAPAIPQVGDLFFTYVPYFEGDERGCPFFMPSEVSSETGSFRVPRRSLSA